jgi:protein TonB
VPVAPSDAEEDVPLEPEQVQEIPPEKPEEKVEEKVEDKIEPEPQTEVAVTVPPPRVEEQPKPEQPPAPAPSAPRAIPKQQSSKLAAAPVQGQPSSNNSSAVQSWKSQVVSMLERNKRYPADARLHRQQGVAQLAFTLDRQGQVATAEIVRSTGSSSLDNETLALVRRAAPFPPPPPELPGAQVSLMVPIRFNFR